MTTRTIRIICAMAAIGALAACGTTPTEADYGNSLASLVNASAYNPATLTSPSDAAVTGVDPDYANNVVVEMRKDVPKPEEVRKPISIQMFSSEGGW
jgi:uncharacterized lipoprotein